MPIRFRCPTCTGLMSIASRKANAVVSCPKCGEQVIVPAPEPARVGATNGSPARRPEADRPLFERPDFDSLLSAAGVPAPPPAKVAVATPAPPPPPVREVVLSYPAAATLGAVALLLVVGSFAAGYLLK